MYLISFHQKILNYQPKIKHKKNRKTSKGIKDHIFIKTKS